MESHFITDLGRAPGTPSLFRSKSSHVHVSFFFKQKLAKSYVGDSPPPPLGWLGPPLRRLLDPRLFCNVGGGVLGKLKPEVLSPPREVPILGGWVILGKLRTKVSESSMISSNSVGGRGEGYSWQAQNQSP